MQTSLLLSRQAIVLCLGLAAVPAFSASVVPAEATVTIRFLVGQRSWPQDTKGNVAFMCIVSPNKMGIKEQCYGFLVQDGMIKAAGPTTDDITLRRNYGKPTPAISVTTSVTIAQRDAMYEMVNQWNRSRHSSDDSCTRLVADLAAAAGLARVSLAAGESPQSYLRRLQQASLENQTTERQPTR